MSMRSFEDFKLDDLAVINICIQSHSAHAQ